MFKRIIMLLILVFLTGCNNHLEFGLVVDNATFKVKNNIVTLYIQVDHCMQTGSLEKEINKNISGRITSVNCHQTSDGLKEEFSFSSLNPDNMQESFIKSDYMNILSLCLTEDEIEYIHGRIYNKYNLLSISPIINIIITTSEGDNLSVKSLIPLYLDGERIKKGQSVIFQPHKEYYLSLDKKITVKLIQDGCVNIF